MGPTFCTMETKWYAINRSKWSQKIEQKPELKQKTRQKCSVLSWRCWVYWFADGFILWINMSVIKRKIQMPWIITGFSARLGKGYGNYRSLFFFVGLIQYHHRISTLVLEHRPQFCLIDVHRGSQFSPPCRIKCWALLWPKNVGRHWQWDTDGSLDPEKLWQIISTLTDLDTNFG